MKFSQIAINSTIADTDYIVGVTSAGVDGRISFATIFTWLKAKLQFITASMIDFTNIPYAFATTASNQSTTSSLTFLSTAVTIPTNFNGRIKLSAMARDMLNSTSGQYVSLSVLWDGVGVANNFANMPTANHALPSNIWGIVAAPTAGAHTMACSIASPGGGGTATAEATINLMMEAV